MDYFVGIDTAQVNQGVSVIDEYCRILFVENTGKAMPKEYQRSGTPDFIKNGWQSERVEFLLKEIKDSIKFVVLEGPAYSFMNNKMESIGSIHGVMQNYFYRNNINFAVVTPKSINIAVLGRGLKIKGKELKEKTKEEVNKIFGTSYTDTNICDSLGMALVAKHFWDFICGRPGVNPDFEYIFASKAKLNGSPKGLIYKRNIKFALFNSDGVVNEEVLIDRLGEK